MKSKLLFTIKCPEKLEEIFSVDVCETVMAIVTGYSVYARAKDGKEIHGIEYKGEVSDVGPIIFAVPEWRKATLEEIQLKK